MWGDISYAIYNLRWGESFLGMFCLLCIFVIILISYILIVYVDVIFSNFVHMYLFMYTIASGDHKYKRMWIYCSVCQLNELLLKNLQYKETTCLASPTCPHQHQHHHHPPPSHSLSLFISLQLSPKAILLTPNVYLVLEMKVAQYRTVITLEWAI